MRGHQLRVLQRATVVEIGGETSCPKRVIANVHDQSSRQRAALHHTPDIDAVHPISR
jgi:hypothetical protein